MSEQNKALEQIVANAESGVSVTYLTGNAGTGKTYTAQQLIKLVKEGTVLIDWKVLDCAPQGKASDIAAGDGDGTTMQSLFKINNRMVLPLGVGYMKYYANRDPVAEVASQAKKYIMKKLGVKSLKRERILLYIEEVMAASAEDLAAVRMIMQNIAESDGVKFHILAVGHPLQNIDDYTEEVKEGDEVVCTNYRTPAFGEPRWDNGEGELVTHHSFFKEGANWATRTIHLKENKRQGEDPLGAVLDKWTTGAAAAIGADLLAILPKGNIHTFAYGMQANKVPVSSFITPAVSQERKINSALVNCEGAMIFLPYIKVGAIEGHIVEYSASSCSVKLAEHGEDAEWIEIPNINKAMFRNCMRSLPVDIENVVVPNMQCLFRNNGVDYKNGTVGRILSFSFTDKLVEVEKENGENIVVEYIRSKELKGDAPFEFMYLPLMTMYAVTTGKVQGCTFNHPVAVCIDARNKSPKPHAAYVGMSRVTNINDLHIVISNVAAEDAVDLSRAEMINQAMVIDAKALAFHAATTGVSTNVDCTATPENTTVAINTNTTNTEETTTMDLNQLNSYVSTYVDIEEEGGAPEEYMSTPENPITFDRDDADTISEADIPESASTGALGGDYTHVEAEEPSEADIPESASTGSLVDSILGESNELIDALEAAEEKLEATEASLVSAQSTIAAQAKEIETLKAQLAAAQKAANDAAIEAKNAKAEAEAAKAEVESAKAEAVPREELLAMRAILDRILVGTPAPVVETAAPVEETPAKEDIPYLDETSELPTTPTTTTTTTTTTVVETPAPNGDLTFRVDGDTKNLKLKKIVADLIKLGFVYQDAGDVNVILTTSGANDINKGVFNINKPAGRQLLTEYASRLVKA